ncbi:MAG: tetratricopeptide repeat protein [Myxococcaceae bacterium]
MRKSLVSLLVMLSVPAFAAAPSAQAKAAFEKGEAALGAGKLDEAAAAYQEAIKATAGYAPALNGLGSVLFKQKKSGEAMQQFRAATEADPTFKLAWFNLGYAARKSSDFAAAAQAYEKYTALDGNDPDGFYGLAESYKGAGQNDKAINAYETYLKKETRATEQKWIDKAKESIAALKAAQPAPAPVATNTPPPANNNVPPPNNTAAPTNTTPPPATNIGSLAQKKVQEGDKLWAEKKYREASFAYQDAVNGNPDDVEALFKLGNAYAVLGYYSQAIDRWTRVQQLSPDPAVKKSAQDNIAKAQQKMTQTGGGTPQEANKAPGTGPVAESTRTQARQYYEGGVQLISQRRYGEALNYLNESLKLEPALTVGYVARGSTLIGLRRFAEAAVDYQYALKLDPNRTDAIYGLAEAYRGMNRIDDARAYYQRYVASNAPDIRPELQSDARNKLQQLR